MSSAVFDLIKYEIATNLKLSLDIHGENRISLKDLREMIDIPVSASTINRFFRDIVKNMHGAVGKRLKPIKAESEVVIKDPEILNAIIAKNEADLDAKMPSQVHDLDYYIKEEKVNKKMVDILKGHGGTIDFGKLHEEFPERH